MGRLLSDTPNELPCQGEMASEARQRGFEKLTITPQTPLSGGFRRKILSGGFMRKTPRGLQKKILSKFLLIRILLMV
jgi:hypothetical protein